MSSWETVMLVISILALVGAAFLVGMWVGLEIPSGEPETAPEERCEEDMPCWNWATMGNQEAKFTVVYHDGSSEEITLKAAP